VAVVPERMSPCPPHRRCPARMCDLCDFFTVRWRVPLMWPLLDLATFAAKHVCVLCGKGRRKGIVSALPNAHAHCLIAQGIHRLQARRCKEKGSTWTRTAHWFLQLHSPPPHTHTHTPHTPELAEHTSAVTPSCTASLGPLLITTGPASCLVTSASFLSRSLCGPWSEMPRVVARRRNSARLGVSTHDL
jgi:hypothetical protein